MQFPGKLTNQTFENGEKPYFGPNFGPFDPNLALQFFLQILLLLVGRQYSKLSLYTI